MNSRKTSWMIWMLGGIILAVLTACSGSDDEPSKPVDDGVKVRRLTISETEDAAAARTLVRHASKHTSDGADATLGKGRRVSGRSALWDALLAKNGVAHYATRASLTEDDGLTASWTAGDGLTYCNLSRTNPMSYDIYSGGLTAASTAATSQFTGDVSCYAGDYLAVVYPATTFETNDSYTISLTGQDGTLATLASTYHYVYGRATVTEMTETTATASMPKMKSLLTVCKFSFVDRATSSPIPIKSLAISYNTGDSHDGTYPQSATVAVKDGSTIKEQSAVQATGVEGNKANNDPPLTITCSTEQGSVYVALLPTTAQSTFNFTVTNSSGTYSGTAKATLTEGEYVVATGLKLTKQ